jgi:hypothetical protein
VQVRARPAGPPRPSCRASCGPGPGSLPHSQPRRLSQHCRPALPACLPACPRLSPDEGAPQGADKPAFLRLASGALDYSRDFPCASPVTVLGLSYGNWRFTVRLAGLPAAALGELGAPAGQRAVEPLGSMRWGRRWLHPSSLPTHQLPPAPAPQVTGTDAAGNREQAPPAWSWQTRYRQGVAYVRATSGPYGPVNKKTLEYGLVTFTGDAEGKAAGTTSDAAFQCLLQPINVSRGGGRGSGSVPASLVVRLASHAATRRCA